MKISVSEVMLCLCIPVFLSGCLDVEATHLKLDLAENTGEEVYSNIFSESLNEEDIKDDFASLLDVAYGEEEDIEGGDIVSRELFTEGDHLSGRIKIIITDKEKLLKGVDIRRGPGGKYVMDIGDNYYASVGGNGALVESGSGLQMVWDSNTSVIEVEKKYNFTGKDRGSLFPYWEAWQAWDSQDQPDSLELLTVQLDDAIKPSEEEYIIDFCPDDTCYSFSSGLMSPGAFNRLADFAYIYLFHISNDVSLDEFKASGGRQMAEIVSRNMRDCADEGEEENARCALWNLYIGYKIKLNAIVYEEMEKKETPIDIWTEF